MLKEVNCSRYTKMIKILIWKEKNGIIHIAKLFCKPKKGNKKLFGG